MSLTGSAPFFLIRCLEYSVKSILLSASDLPPVLMWNVANALISNIQILANSNKRKLSKKIK